MTNNIAKITMWTQAEAIELCKAIEKVAPVYGCHVALTGGLLYKDGPRKDCDILFYRIRQVEEIDVSRLIDALEVIGMDFDKGKGWVFKFFYKDKPIDAFFPEQDSLGDWEY